MRVRGLCRRCFLTQAEPALPCLLPRCLSRVYFWGKMQGMQRDYLIAQGLAESAGDKKKEAENGGSDMTVAQFFDTLQAIPKKTFRLGPDGVSWTILPTVTGEMKAQDADWRKSLQATGQVFTPLTGDISHKYEWSTMTGPPAEDDEEKKPTPEAKEMVEDVRLACMVEEIDTATSVIPVGSFILNSSSRVVANPYFRGLDLSAGLKLESYLHLRKPLQLQNAPISERAVLSKSTQFLDALTMDQPKVSPDPPPLALSLCPSLPFSLSLSPSNVCAPGSAS